MNQTIRTKKVREINSHINILSKNDQSLTNSKYEVVGMMINRHHAIVLGISNVTERIIF